MISPKLLVHFLTVVLKDLGKQLKDSLRCWVNEAILRKKNALLDAETRLRRKKGSLRGRHRH